MSSVIETAVYVLGDDIDTDQIIPARHLAISLDDPAERAKYGGLALSGLPRPAPDSESDFIPFADPNTNTSPFKILIAGKNFGCGSSREHAPVALAEAGVQAIIARSYARIFFRNAVDGGYVPPYQCDENLATILKTGDRVQFDREKRTLTVLATGQEFTMGSLGAAEAILESGGVFAYARKLGLVQKLASENTPSPKKMEIT